MNLGTEGIRRKDYIPPSNVFAGVRSCGWGWKYEKPLPMMVIQADALVHPEVYLERTAMSPLTFHMKDMDILLVPLFTLHYSRYAMYWRFSASVDAKVFPETAAKEVDACFAYGRFSGDSDDVNEKAPWSCDREDGFRHWLYGNHHEHSWRSASSDGFFVYRLAVGDAPDKRVFVAKYCVRECGGREFDVFWTAGASTRRNGSTTGSRGSYSRECPSQPNCTKARNRSKSVSSRNPETSPEGSSGFGSPADGSHSVTPTETFSGWQGGGVFRVLLCVEGQSLCEVFCVVADSPRPV